MKNGEGEICSKGRCQFVGYYKDAERTRSVVDNEGYYHTGDLGYFDKDGYLTITGRIKELLKTSGGEYVAPIYIEETFAEICQISSQMVVIGNDRKYLTALITLRTQPDNDGKPTTEISQDCNELLNSIGSSAKTLADAIECPKLKEYINRCISELNSKAISHAQEIRKWTILPRDFSTEEEELTPTLKLRRDAIYTK